MQIEHHKVIDAKQKENGATVIIEYDENDYVTEKEKIQSEYGNSEYIDYGTYGKCLIGFEYEGYRFIYINRYEPPFPQSLMLIDTNDGEQKIAFVCYGNTEVQLEKKQNGSIWSKIAAGGNLKHVSHHEI